jgi:hypothetical protein
MLKIMLAKRTTNSQFLPRCPYRQSAQGPRWRLMPLGEGANRVFASLPGFPGFPIEGEPRQTL